MARYGYQQVSFGGPLTPGVKSLIVANMAAFLLQALIRPFTDWFSLSVVRVLPWDFQLWRVGTYMFLHGGVGHLFWNMLALFLFGGAIESTWGTRSFYRYYFLCGLGGALFAFMPYANLWQTPIIGASGAVYGVLLAYGILFPNNRIYVLATFPVEAKYLVTFYFFISFVSALSGSEGVAHMVHLGGFVTGYLLLRWAGMAGRRASAPSVGGWGSGADAGASTGLVGSVREAYRRWKMKRLRKKFEVYYENRTDSGTGTGTGTGTGGNGRDRDRDRDSDIIH